jgi:hypothetical protein
MARAAKKSQRLELGFHQKRKSLGDYPIYFDSFYGSSYVRVPLYPPISFNLDITLQNLSL